MKTIREICDSNFGGNWKLIETLEAREKERDEAERRRVRAAVNGISFTEGHRKSILDAIYPHPEKLPAGWYAIRFKELVWLIEYTEPFVPEKDNEYRRIENPFDPPPEVTGKKMPSALKSVCCDRYADNMPCDCPKVEQQSPTAQEWIEKNVVGWDEPDNMFWYKSSTFPKSPFRNVPDEVFDKLKSPLVGEPPMAVYHSHDEALADLKRVLIEMGLAR